MGGISFVAAVLFVLMGMGRWQETGNVYWLSAASTIAFFTLVFAIGALTRKGK